MDPPSYEEARHPPPPAYDASLPASSTPPPTYGEAVSSPPDPFPVLLIPGPRPGVGGSPAATAIVNQPRPSGTVAPGDLRGVPAATRCPHCRHVVVTKVKYLAGRAAWAMCLLLTLMGLICGFCLIPFFLQEMKDAHHFCPRCLKLIHIYVR